MEEFYSLLLQTATIIYMKHCGDLVSHKKKTEVEILLEKNPKYLRCPVGKTGIVRSEIGAHDGT